MQRTLESRRHAPHRQLHGAVDDRVVRVLVPEERDEVQRALPLVRRHDVLEVGKDLLARRQVGRGPRLGEGPLALPRGEDRVRLVEAHEVVLVDPLPAPPGALVNDHDLVAGGEVLRRRVERADLDRVDSEKMSASEGDEYDSDCGHTDELKAVFTVRVFLPPHIQHL